MQVGDERSGPSILQCLICKEYTKVDGFLFHIYSHFKYTRNKCRDCEFSCNSEEQATFHGISKKHLVVKAVDNYIESISAKILVDCYEAGTNAEENSFPNQEVIQVQPQQIVDQNCIHSSALRQKEALEEIIAERLRGYTCGNHSMHVILSPQKTMSLQPNSSTSVSSGQCSPATQTETVVSVSSTVRSPQKTVTIQSNRNSSMHYAHCLAVTETQPIVPVLSMVRSPQKAITDLSSGSTISSQQVTPTREACTSSHSFISTSDGLNRSANLRHQEPSNSGLGLDQSCVRMRNSLMDNPLPHLNRISSDTSLRDALAFSVTKTSHSENDLPIIRKKRRVRQPANVAFVENHVPLPVSLESMMLRPRVTCKKCGLEIDESYIVRRTHVLQNHCSDKNDPEILELLAAEMRVCFPSFVAFSDDQCNLCGKQYIRQRTKRDHVVKKHLDQFYSCMIRPCSLSYKNLGYLRKHIQYRHGRHFLLKSRENTTVWQQLEQMKRDYETSLERQLKVCFPCDVSNMTITRVAETESLAGIPRASASEKVAHLLQGVVRAPRTVQRPVHSSSDSSGSDSDDDVQIIEPQPEEGTSEQPASCIIAPKPWNNDPSAGDRIASEECFGSSLKNDTNPSRQTVENGTEDKTELQNYLMSQAAPESQNQITPEATKVSSENSVRYWQNGFFVEDSVSSIPLPQPYGPSPSSSVFGRFVQ